MSIERLFHCDWRECQCHERTVEGRPRAFMTVVEPSDQQLHFCSWDCLLKFAGEKPPVELFPLEEAG